MTELTPVPPRHHWITLSILSLLLAACAPMPAVEDALTRRSADALQQWRMQGKMALRGPEAAHNVRFVWQQSGTRFDIEMSGPLGMGKMRLSGQNGELESVSRGGDPIDHTEARAELLRDVGWDMPLAHLQYWLRGLTSPQPAPITEEHQNHHLIAAEQDGWTLTWRDHQQRNIGNRAYALPSALELTRDNYRARLKVLNWSSGNNSS